MRSNILLYVIVCGLSLLSSCDKSTHKDEKGVVVTLNLPNDDKLEDIDIRIFSSDDVLMLHQNIADANDLASSLIHLEDGDYTIVATSSANGHFTHSEQVGKTILSELLLTMKEPYTAQSHTYYGISEVKVSGESYSNEIIDASSIFAEVSVSVKKLNKDIVSVEMIVKNSAKGVYPAIHKLTKDYNAIHLGKAVVEGNSAQFPILAVMPTVAMTPNSREEHKTFAEFVFHYKNGRKVTMSATLPRIENGGTYNAEVDFTLLKEGVIVNITDIVGWGDGGESDGEILNPI